LQIVKRSEDLYTLSGKDKKNIRLEIHSMPSATLMAAGPRCVVLTTPELEAVMLRLSSARRQMHQILNLKPDLTPKAPASKTGPNPGKKKTTKASHANPITQFIQRVNALP